ncbi:MCE family protein [Erwinia psidii]|uniref:PqiB family protein n=1 Tax=Erwinia psidii TaxID=69224 RepID=UPI00226B97A0|nr:MlaD family protein [Erwinia psidii]MCX8966028.1 MCE family protein [Erwinia psidii]
MSKPFADENQLPHQQPRGKVAALIWLIPLASLLAGLALFTANLRTSGTEITLTFQNAAGLEAGKTPLKYRDITVGMLKSLSLDNKGENVIAVIALNKDADYLARSGSRFWVVRPRVGFGGVSGLETMLSGAWIAADRGNDGQEMHQFTGLETPPAQINGVPGHRFTVITDDLGSLDIGSPVYFRRVQVGRIVSWRLQDDGKAVAINLFIDAPYDRLVTRRSRFWNASGMDLSVGANGLHLKTQTVASVIAGGIAFRTPDDVNAPENNADGSYELAKDEEQALSPPDGPSVPFQLRFERSLKGLSPGAPVEFSSITIGRVVSVSLDYSPVGYRFPSVVNIEVYPNRLGNVLNKLPRPGKDLSQAIATFTRDMVEHGLRAQAATGNLLTGQLYISLDFQADAHPVPFDMTAHPLVIPTVNGGFERIQQQVASIVGKVDNMPLEAMGNQLNAALAGTNLLLQRLNTRTLPQADKLVARLDSTTGTVQTLLSEDSPLMITAAQSLQELSRMLRAVRALGEQLNNNPEALIKGRPAQTAPELPPSERSGR